MEVEDDGQDDGPPTEMGGFEDLPPRIEACFRHLYWDTHREQSTERRANAREEATYNAALDCLKLYFLGEQDHEA